MKTTAIGFFRRQLLRLHRDERGAISVLVLLMIWCLVALLAMVWNTTEEAAHRQKVQTAADSAAQAAATWVGRSVNAIAAQNMVICQDASTETIWRAISPTDQAIANRFTSEIALAQQMKVNGGVGNLQRQIQQQLAQIASEYQLTSDALAVLNAGTGANYANPMEAITYQNSARQAGSVMNWVTNTYVNGQAPANGPPPAPARPGPPGPNGEGLAQIIARWQPSSVNDAILDYIINYINTTERSFLTQFETRTQPATSQDVGGQMAGHEQEAYGNELAMAAALPDTIEQQRAQLSDFYKMDITLATLGNSSGSSGPASVQAPLVPAADVPPVTGYTDSIRQAYPVQAAQAGLPLTFDIDAISPNTGPAMIWHPNVALAVDPAIRAQYPGLAPSYTLQSTIPNGWGHNWSAPLEQYFYGRVNNDQVQINNDNMLPLDNARTGALATAIRQMLGFPTNLSNIAPLPPQIGDDRPDPTIQPPPVPPVYRQVQVMPVLTAPPAADASYRSQVTLYNQHSAAFIGAVNSLRGTLESYIVFYNRFTQAFAQAAWTGNVAGAQLTVVQNLGTGKQFMVLATYGLRQIPDWAKDGMFVSVQVTAEDYLVRTNMLRVINDIMRSNAVTYAVAAQIADWVIRPAAHNVALEIAAEWINRPWPYEITPPASPVPPTRGIGRDDRQRYFSVLAAARETDANGPRLLLPNIFGIPNTKLVAYGQAETFNWMEYNNVYGGSERFDQVTPSPWNNNNSLFLGSPRGWRVASLGGWNWRSRLSLADMAGAATQNNDELQAYFNDAGITTLDSAAIDSINVH